MPERVVLVGAGDHGRGVLEILRRAGAEVLGFVDDAGEGKDTGGLPLLGTTSWLLSRLGSPDPPAVILALASPSAKRTLAARLEGATWARAVHPRADLATGVTVGPGTVVASGVVVAYDTALGAHVTVNLNATIGHHVAVGDHVTIAPGANILGKVTLGEGCQVHANATVLPSIRLGARCTVGAGAVVLADVPDGATVFGNPARPVPAVRR